MKNRLAFVPALALVALVAVGCAGQGELPVEPLAAPDNARLSGGIFRMIESELQLSDAQKAAFKKLADELATEREATHQARKAELQAFANAFKGETLSDADIDRIAPHVFSKERHALMQAKLVQAHQLLTPEQRAKIADKLQARLDKMAQKREKRAEKRKPGEMMGGFMLKKITRDLDLTQSQQTAVAQIVADVQTQLRRDEAPAERAQMQAFIREFRKDKMDETALNQGFAELEAKQAELRAAMKNAIKSVHATLTPEQRAKAAEKMLQMAERHAKRGDGKPCGRGKHREIHCEE